MAIKVQVLINASENRLPTFIFGTRNCPILAFGVGLTDAEQCIVGSDQDGMTIAASSAQHNYWDRPNALNGVESP